MKNTKKTVQELIEDRKRKHLRFDLKIQRSEGIWNKKTSSKFIHSILLDWATPNLFATKEGSALNFVDGKQRLTTAIAFVENKLVLHKTTPLLNDFELAGKTFKELPEEMQEAVLNYVFNITIIEEASAEDLEEFFYRLNSGVPLRQIETTRAILGGRVLRFVEDIANTAFFQEKANISKTAKKRYVDQELVLQILSFIDNDERGFGGREIEGFVRELRNQRTQDELKSKLTNAAHYLNLVYVKKERNLRKLHIPMIFRLVLDIQENGLLIQPTDFEAWSKVFFENMPDDYKTACQSGSAKKENVKKRYISMKSHFDEYFKHNPSQAVDAQESAS